MRGFDIACSFEKLVPRTSVFLPKSPSSSVTGRPPVSRNLVAEHWQWWIFRTDSPVKKMVTPSCAAAITAPQLVNHFRIGEPGAEYRVLHSDVAQVSAGNVQHSAPFLTSSSGHIDRVFQVHIMLKNMSYDVRFVLLKYFLRFVRTGRRVCR